MKFAGLLLTFVMLGYGAATVKAAYLTHPWINLRLDRVIGDWLSTFDLETLERVWVIVWMYLPEWTIASLAGISLRILFGSRAPTFTFSFCFGFALIPELEFIADRNNWQFGLAVVSGDFLWSLLSFPIAVIFASLSFRRWDSAPSHRPFQFSILRLVFLIAGFALLCVLAVHSRLIGLPSFLLGSLTWLAYTTVRFRNHESTVSRDSMIAEP